ncbi:Radial spoke head protein 4 A [Sparganum proliferum]
MSDRNRPHFQIVNESSPNFRTPNEITGGFCNLGPEAPPLEEFVKAKALLQSMHSGGRAHHDSIDTDGKQSSLYEHLVSLVKYILEYQPSHSLDHFESLSLLVKRERGAGAGGSEMAAGLKEESMEAKALTVQPCTDEVTNAMAERTLLKHPEHVWDQPPIVGGPPLRPFEGNFEDDEESAALPNLSNHALLIEQAGIGVGREELMRVWLALRLLHKKLPSVTALRFWGKIFGTKANYYIAEAEFEAESEPDEEVPGPWDKWRLPKPPKNKGDQDPTDFQVSPPLSYYCCWGIREITVLLPPGRWFHSGSGRLSLFSYFTSDLLDDEEIAKLPLEKRVLIKLPKNKWKPPSPYPWEPRGRGMNRWDYYICTELGDGKWMRLPITKPVHIEMARQSVYIFTGDPNTPIGHLPGGLGLFPGLEAHYLRAQIARISSACTVSPAGVYEVDEEDEVEEGEKPESLLLAEEYEPLEFTELLDLANWVHHRPYLYGIGRINWMSTKKAAKAYKALMAEEEGEEAEPEDEEEMAEEGEEEEEEEPEEGPDLLTPVEEDQPMRPIGNIGLSRIGSPGEFLAPAWRVRPSTVLLPANCAVAVLSNVRWPGAYAMARKETFVNIYIGWGNKVLGASYMPIRSANPAKEFDEEATPLQEAVDPTPLQEEELRLMKEAKRLAAEAKAEEGEEEEEGDED